MNMHQSRDLHTDQTFRLLLMAVSFFVAMSLSGFSSAQEMVRSGEFSTLSKHVTTGSVTVAKTEDGYVITLGEDFSFDGAPDPRVALGNDGTYDPATLLESLRSNTGEQSYSVPASIDASAYNEVYIWCEKFSVALGVAQLK